MKHETDHTLHLMSTLRLKRVLPPIPMYAFMAWYLGSGKLFFIQSD